MSNSRRASSPATRKKNAIRPEFTQPCQLSATLLVPDRITSTVCHVAAYPDGSMFAQASAARAAASRTAALPVSVRRNRRSGVSRLRAHTVRSEKSEAGESGSVTLGFSPAPRRHARALAASAQAHGPEVLDENCGNGGGEGDHGYRGEPDEEDGGVPDAVGNAQHHREGDHLQAGQRCRCPAAG